VIYVQELPNVRGHLRSSSIRLWFVVLDACQHSSCTGGGRFAMGYNPTVDYCGEPDGLCRAPQH